MYNIFTKPDDEKFHKVYKNNMAGKEDPFIGVKKGTSKILKTPNCAYIHTKHQIDWLKECGNCEIEFIPWQQLVGYNSIPMVKASPYEPFMREMINMLQGNGKLNQLRQKWSLEEPPCAENEVKPISYQKVIVCFILVLFGMAVSLIILIAEKLLFNQGKKSIFVKHSKPEVLVVSRVTNFIIDLLNQQTIPDDKLIEIIHLAASTIYKREDRNDSA